MRFILNVLWFIFGSGFLLAIGYGIAALICFALIVTIPFGVAALRLAAYSMWPFGRTVVTHPGAGVPSGIANVIWVVVAGWWLALTHVVTGIAQCITSSASRSASPTSSSPRQPSGRWVATSSPLTEAPAVLLDELRYHFRRAQTQGAPRGTRSTSICLDA